MWSQNWTFVHFKKPIPNTIPFIGHLSVYLLRIKSQELDKAFSMFRGGAVLVLFPFLNSGGGNSKS